jgi:hypothetical protein
MTLICFVGKALKMRRRKQASSERLDVHSSTGTATEQESMNSRSVCKRRNELQEQNVPVSISIADILWFRHLFVGWVL